MPNSNPRQVFDHHLDALKGWPAPHALDFHAPLVSGLTATVWAGKVMTLNASGQFVPGLLSQAMPIFIRQNEDDYDTGPFPGATAGRTFGSDGPLLSGLVATGPYELQTTEFIDGTYLPNDVLTSKTEAELGGNESDAGKVTLGFGFYNDDVCGVVSKGKLTNHNAKSVLQFWSFFLPHNPINNLYY